MVWGAVAGLAGGLLQGNSAKNESRRQGRNLARYERAFNDISAAQEQNENRLMSDQGALSAERYQDLEALAAALGSPRRGDAGRRSGRDLSRRMDAAVLPIRAAAAPRGGTPSFGRWARAFRAERQPALDARRAAAIDRAEVAGRQDYDQGAFDTLSERQTDVGRRSGEATRRSTLMQGYMDRLLGQEAQRFRYTGPSNSFYNAQLVGSLMQLAGTGVDGYLAGRQQRQPTTMTV